MQLQLPDRLPVYRRRPTYTADPRRLGQPPTDDNRLTSADDELAQSGVPQPDRLPAYNPPAAPAPSSPNVQTAPMAAPDRLPTYNPPAYSQTAAQHYQDLLNSPVEDQNGRFKSGANVGLVEASQAARESGSVGRTIGAGLGGFLTGLIRPKTDEEMRRPGQLQRAAQAAAVEAAQNKQKQEQQAAEDEGRLRRAEAAKAEAEAQNVGPAAQAKAQEQRRKDLLNQLRLIGRYKAGENAQFDNQLHEAGLFVDDFEKGAGSFSLTDSAGRKLVFNKKTGALTQGELDGQAVVDTSKTPDAEGLLPRDRQRAEIARLARESHERIASTQASLRRQQLDISKGRASLSKEQFRARYPLYGQTLSHDYLMRKYETEHAKDRKVKLQDIIEDAIKQGATIQEEP